MNEANKKRFIAIERSCTDDLINKIGLFRKDAAMAADRAQKVSVQDMFNIGELDTFRRLQRNCTALYTLLSLAIDTAEYIRQELLVIYGADIEHSYAVSQRQAAALARELAYQKKKKYNDKSK